MWKVVTNSNLNSPLKLFFYLPILTNNNLLLKIYYENIVIAFLNCHFLFLYYFSFLNYIHTFLFFFSWFFLHHTRIPLISLSTLLCLFLVHSRSHFLQLSLSSSLFFYFFYLKKSYNSIKNNSFSLLSQRQQIFTTATNTTILSLKHL